MQKASYYVNYTYQEFDSKVVIDPQDMIAQDTQFLNNRDYYGPIAFANEDSLCKVVKRSKSEELRALDHDNLDTFDHEPSPNVTEEEKSELMPET